MQLKKQLKELVVKAENNKSSINYSTAVKRPHYYTNQPVNLTAAEKRILELQQVAAKQADVIKGFDVYIQNI